MKLQNWHIVIRRPGCKQTDKKEKRVRKAHSPLPASLPPKEKKRRSSRRREVNLLEPPQSLAPLWETKVRDADPRLSHKIIRTPGYTRSTKIDHWHGSCENKRKHSSSIYRAMEQYFHPWTYTRPQTHESQLNSVLCCKNNQVKAKLNIKIS